MNALERWIDRNSIASEPHAICGLETVCMNHLQSEGVISDECVMAKDVCDGDAERAVQWLDGLSA